MVTQEMLACDIPTCVTFNRKLLKVKGKLIVLVKRVLTRKSRVYLYMELWHDLYNYH